MSPEVQSFFVLLELALEDTPKRLVTLIARHPVMDVLRNIGAPKPPAPEAASVQQEAAPAQGAASHTPHDGVKAFAYEPDGA